MFYVIFKKHALVGAVIYRQQTIQSIFTPTKLASTDINLLSPIGLIGP